jgi:hypothetical protein
VLRGGAHGAGSAGGVWGSDSDGGELGEGCGAVVGNDKARGLQVKKRMGQKRGFGLQFWIWRENHTMALFNSEGPLRRKKTAWFCSTWKDCDTIVAKRCHCK